MGKQISKFSQKICTKSVYHKVLILGLEGSGKTTLYDRLRSNEIYITHPTIGFNVEQVKVDWVTTILWDFGGHEKIMSLWEKYFENTDLVILVLDSTDTSNYDKIRVVLQMIQDKLKNVYVIILINKIDLPDSQETELIVKQIDLYKYSLKIAKVIRTSTVRGDGMKEVTKAICSSLQCIVS
jgi:small GTP-binding protein